MPGYPFSANEWQRLERIFPAFCRFVRHVSANAQQSEALRRLNALIRSWGRDVLRRHNSLQRRAEAVQGLVLDIRYVLFEASCLQNEHGLTLDLSFLEGLLPGDVSDEPEENSIFPDLRRAVWQVFPSDPMECLLLLEVAIRSQLMSELQMVHLFERETDLREALSTGRARLMALALEQGVRIPRLSPLN